MSDMSSDVCSSDLEYLRDRDSTDAQCQCRANMEPEPQHVEGRRVGVYRYVNELAGKLAERTPIGWNRIIAAIGVEQIGLELQHRIKFCRPESAAPRNMCPFHLFLPARDRKSTRLNSSH